MGNSRQWLAECERGTECSSLYVRVSMCERVSVYLNMSWLDKKEMAVVT